MKSFRTPAMKWIINNHTDPPEWMYHDPKIKTYDKMTIAMLWIYNVKTEPPIWM